jgi:hypothetical protein
VSSRSAKTFDALVFIQWLNVRNTAIKPLVAGGPCDWWVSETSASKLFLAGIR